MRNRIFRAAYVRSDSATGIGITEETAEYGGSTIAIYSLYSSNRVSNRDAVVSILQTIRNLLNDGERARLSMHQFHRSKGYHDPYKLRIDVKYIPYKTGNTYQSELLADDALRRKSDVIEVFERPIHFNIIESKKDEGKGRIY